MDNTTQYKGFQLEVILDLHQNSIIGKIIPNKEFPNLEFQVYSESVPDLLDQFEQYIDEFLEERKEIFQYKNAILNISKEGGSNNWKGYMFNSRLYWFTGDSSESIIRQFVEYIDGLEESVLLWNKLQNDKNE